MNTHLGCGDVGFALCFQRAKVCDVIFQRIQSGQQCNDFIALNIHDFFVVSE